MPDIDLEPHEFADRDSRTGKWRRPLSKRAARNWFFASLVPLIFLGATASQGSPLSLYGCTLMFAFFSGVFAQQWLKDLY